MKPLRVFLCALLTLAGLSTAWAATDDNQALAQRLDRLEQQVHQLADRQPQSNPRPAPMPDQPPGQRSRDGQMGPQYNAPQDGRAECYYPHRRHRSFCCFLVTLAVVLAVVHVLLAVWVFTDIRKRGEGSGIFIVLALLIGVPGAILYLLARIGDRKAT